MTIYRSGELYGDKIKYPDGVGCCIWRPLPGDEHPETGGLAWDFTAEEIPDLIILLGKLIKAPAVLYKEE